MRTALRLIAAGLVLAACSPAGPRALVAGTDECGYCRMTITDVRFGAQAIAPTGKVVTFDAVECAANYAATADRGAVASLWVADFERPGTWLPADSAVFVVDARVTSPMGRSLVALAPGTVPAAAVARCGGAVRGWDELVADARRPAAAVHGAHAHAH